MHLRRLVTPEGSAVFVHPNRVLGIYPAVVCVSGDGVADRCVISYREPHVVREVQIEDTRHFLIAGTPDDVVIALFGPTERKG